jgi:hypothetical protein
MICTISRHEIDHAITQEELKPADHRGPIVKELLAIERTSRNFPLSATFDHLLNCHLVAGYEKNEISAV